MEVGKKRTCLCFHLVKYKNKVLGYYFSEVQKRKKKKWICKKNTMNQIGKMAADF
jgi:hypothetical protein